MTKKEIKIGQCYWTRRNGELRRVRVTGRDGRWWQVIDVETGESREIGRSIYILWPASENISK